MARKKTLRSKEREMPSSPRGPRSLKGPAGPPGQDGKLVAELGAVLARIAQELEDVQRTLRVQFTRIAELQAELDDLRATLKKAN